MQRGVAFKQRCLRTVRRRNSPPLGLPVLTSANRHRRVASKPDSAIDAQRPRKSGRKEKSEQGGKRSEEHVGRVEEEQAAVEVQLGESFVRLNSAIW
jgi:hypothetical protein